ncbi:RNA polymerase subunit sigma, partial [Acinetobacter baumannii]
MTSAAASHHDDLGDQLHSPAFL